MMARLVFIGLSITSSWGNGHATTYRALIKALAARGHDVVFLEQDQPWYASHRDLAHPPYCTTHLYSELAELYTKHCATVLNADAVVIGSYVAKGAEVGRWALQTANGPVAFYDIDTPETLAALEEGRCDYLSLPLLGDYDLYLSFTGGPLLERLCEMGARRAAPLYCSVDPAVHMPRRARTQWSLGYLGTYSPDRQPALEMLLLDVARARTREQFVVAGAQYPDRAWPSNVQHITHLAPDDHAAFYCAQSLTLNITRAQMRKAGYSPSVRLFEAAACGVPIVTDRWPGLREFFEPGVEIFCAENTNDVLEILSLPDVARERVADAAYARVLTRHTSLHRAIALEQLLRIAPLHTRAKTRAPVNVGGGTGDIAVR